MKKVGAITAAIGFLLALGLFFVRRSSWFARQMEKNISEFGEMTEAAFWAALIMTAVGIVLLLFGLRIKNRIQDAIDTPAPLADEWVCPACGEVNRGGELCALCGADRRGPEPEPWICSYCGAGNPDGTESCLVCGTPRWDGVTYSNSNCDQGGY